jgi:tetratricopeptide (TPR) repeat protein
MLGSSSPVDEGPRRGVPVVPEAIRRARDESGLTLSQIAEPELTRGTIWLIEQGRARPSLRTLRQIADRTGRPVSYFLASAPAVTEQQRANRDGMHRLVETQDFEGAIALGRALLDEPLSDHLEAEVCLLMGRAFVRCGDGTAACEYLLRAERLCEFISDRLMTIEVLDALGCAYFLTDDPRMLKVGWEALHSAERLVPAAPSLMVQILLHLGSFLLRVRDWTRAVECYEHALRLSAGTPNLRNVAMLHDQLSVAHQWLGHTDHALHHAAHATRLYAGSKDATDAIRAANNMGWLLMKQNQLDAAARQLTRALQLCDEHQINRQGFARGHVLLNLAELNIARGDLDAADVQLSEALQSAIALNQIGHQATSLRLIGRLHAKRGDYTLAAQAFDEAVSVFQGRRLLAEVAEVLQEKGAVLMTQGRVLEAADCWRLATTNALEAINRSHQGGAQDLEPLKPMRCGDE